ncbi:MAG: hypothetical protein ACYDG2_02545 [Ruminiclostridium sp.]
MDKSPNAGISTTYVNITIPVNKLIVDKRRVNIHPFLYNKHPIVIPREPVVSKKIMASCGLTIKIIIADKNRTTIPIGISITAASSTGKLLNGLKAIPIAGKKTGAD